MKRIARLRAGIGIVAVFIAGFFAQAGRPAQADLFLKAKPGSSGYEAVGRMVAGLAKVVARDDRSGLYRIRPLPGHDVDAVKAALAHRVGVAYVREAPPLPPTYEVNPNSVSSLRHRIDEIEHMPKSASRPDADALQAYLYYVQQRAFPYDAIDWAAMQRAAVHRDKMPSVAFGQTATGQKAGLAYGSWEFVGPNNLDIPYRVYYGIRPLSGRINSIAYDPTNPNNIYLGGATGGLWKSPDHGVTWTCLGDKWEKMPVSSIAIDPTHPATIYVGTGDFHGGSGYSIGMMKTTDGGVTWTNLGRSVFGDVALSQVLVDPDNPQIVTATGGRGAANYGKVYRSTDGGQTWSTAVNVQAAWGDADFGVPAAGKRTYYAVAGGSGGQIYRSTDGGVTWASVAKPSGATLDGTVDVAASKIDAATVYLLSTADQKIYKSTNRGDTWSDVTGSFPGGYNWSQGWYDYHITTGKRGTADLVFVGLIDIVYSPDGAATWVSMGGPTYSDSAITHNDQHSLAVNPTDQNEVLVGNDGGIFLYTFNPGTGTWSSSGLNRALGVTQFYKASWHPTDPNNMVGGTQDNATPESAGDILNWNCVGGGDGGGTAINPANPLVQYCTCYNLLVYRTGDSWTSSQYIAPDIGSDNAPFVSAIGIDPNNPRYLYGGTNYLYRWDDTLQTWTSHLGNQNMSGGVISTIAVAPSNSSVIYTGTSDGKVWRSGNAGTNWTEIDSGLPNRSVSMVSVSRTNPNDIVVCLSGTGSNHVWRCLDASASNRTWQTIDGSGATGLPDTPVNGIARDYKDNNGTLFVATDVGVFMTTTGGQTWGNATSPLGLPNVQVNDIGITPSTGYLFAATWGRGMWRMKLPTASITLNTLGLAPTDVVGGTTVQGTVTLDIEAPPGGTKVGLASDSKLALPGASVIVPSGQKQANFTVRTSTTQTPTTAHITATLGAKSLSAALSVNPQGIKSLTLDPASVPGGTSSTGTVTLGAAAPAGGTVVTLAVDNTTVAHVDWSVTVPAGQNSAQFTVTTIPVASTTQVVVRASAPGPTKYATLTITPAVGIAAVTVVPSSVKGGTIATGTVSLTMAAPSDLTITLSSSDTSGATVPASVVVKKGAQSAKFVVTTLRVKVKKTPSITAQYNGYSRSTTLAVNP